MRAELGSPFSAERLIATALLRVADDRYFWYLRCHHVIMDGYSGPMIAQRLAEVYTALAEGRDPEPGNLGSLATLLEEDAAYRASARHQADRRHWLAVLDDLPAVPTLSSGTAPSGTAATSRFHRRSTTMRHEDAAALTEAALSHGTSVPGLVIAAIAAFVARLGGAREVVLGLAVTARTTRPPAVPRGCSPTCSRCAWPYRRRRHSASWSRRSPGRSGGCWRTSATATRTSAARCAGGCSGRWSTSCGSTTT
nr:hypothetical protein GCM10020093_038880 [Planobispora longispora]